MAMVSEFDATLSCWVAEGCHFIVAVAGLSFYHKTLSFRLKCVLFCETAYMLALLFV